jgi:Tfp pilus assembly protein PilF
VWKRAMDECRTAIAMNVNRVEYRYLLADLYLEQKLYYEAVAQLREVLETGNRGVDTYLRIARIYLAINDLERADETIKTAMSMAPDNPEAKALAKELGMRTRR